MHRQTAHFLVILGLDPRILRQRLKEDWTHGSSPRVTTHKFGNSLFPSDIAIGAERECQTYGR